MSLTLPNYARLLLYVLSLGTLLNLSPPAKAQESVIKEKDDPLQTVWRIDQPQVDTPRKDYRQVTFQKYDEVIVTGGGCVNTRGSGQTNFGLREDLRLGPSAVRKAGELPLQ